MIFKNFSALNIFFDFRFESRWFQSSTSLSQSLFLSYTHPWSLPVFYLCHIHEYVCFWFIPPKWDEHFYIFRSSLSPPLNKVSSLSPSKACHSPCLSIFSLWILSLSILILSLLSLSILSLSLLSLSILSLSMLSLSILNQSRYT